MKNIDFKMVFQILWIFIVAGAFILLSRILNPNGIPDDGVGLLEMPLNYVLENALWTLGFMILFIGLLGLYATRKRRGITLHQRLYKVLEEWWLAPLLLVVIAGILPLNASIQQKIFLILFISLLGWCGNKRLKERKE